MEVFEEEEVAYCDHGEHIAGGGAGLHKKGVVLGASLFQHERDREKTNASCCSLGAFGGSCDRKKCAAEDRERGAAGCLSLDELDQEGVTSRN